MSYFDFAYIAKFYVDEPESDAVRQLAESLGHVHCSALGRIEVTSVFHRKWREGAFTKRDFREVSAQRLAQIKRDGGMCCKCKALGKPLHAEHSFPLELVNRSDYPNCLKYWSLEYLETCCVDCHKPKTKREAKARAKVKRIIAKREGRIKPKRKLPSRSFPKLTPALKALKKKIEADRRQRWKIRTKAVSGKVART